jgi:hypothetical protein
MTDTPKRPRGRPGKPAAERLSERIDLWADPILAAAIKSAGPDRVREILRAALTG